MDYWGPLVILGQSDKDGRGEEWSGKEVLAASW